MIILQYVSVKTLPEPCRRPKGVGGCVVGTDDDVVPGLHHDVHDVALPECAGAGASASASASDCPGESPDY